MLEILVVGLLLIISIFLAFINWRIYKVTLEMLDVTIAIYLRTINLSDYTKKTYEILGGEEGLTNLEQGSKLSRKKEGEDGL